MMICGLFWLLVIYHLKYLGGDEEMDDFKFFLNDFVSNYLPPQHKIFNLNEDWKDGKVILKFLKGFHLTIPIDIERDLEEDAQKNYQLALDLAHQHLDIPKIFEYEDLTNSSSTAPRILTIYLYFFVLYKNKILEKVKIINK